MKLRPMRKPEDLAAVPLNQPVLVELEPEATAIIRDDQNDQPVEKAADERSGEDILKEQLEATKKANEETSKRLEAANRERDEAIRIANEKNRELHTAKRRAEASDADSIDAALSAAQQEQEAAKSSLRRATADADADAMADAQVKLSLAATDIRNLEIAKGQVSDHLNKSKDSKPDEIRLSQQNLDPIAVIDANPNLMPTEKEWLKSHKDLIERSDSADQLGRAYNFATQSHGRGTPGYFAKMNEYFGYANQRKESSEDDQAMTSAPVNRDAPNVGGGNSSSNSIRLSPEQRDFARSMGLTDVQYAQQLKNLQEDKRNNPERYSLRS